MTRTPIPVRDRASSPAFVSRVSPTVSSLPMLSSSAVRSRRRSKAVMFSQRNAPLAGWLAHSGALLSSNPTHRARTDLEHSPGRSERDPRSLDAAARRAAARGSAAARAATRWAAAGQCASAAARPARPDRCGARCRHRPRPGTHRPRQGRGRCDRQRGRQGRGARRARHRPGHLRGLPARHRDVAVARGVAARLDGLGRASRLPVVRVGRDGGGPARARHQRQARRRCPGRVDRRRGGGRSAPGSQRAEPDLRRDRRGTGPSRRLRHHGRWSSGCCSSDSSA